jgi:hypothetical protein
MVFITSCIGDPGRVQNALMINGTDIPVLVHEDVTRGRNTTTRDPGPPLPPGEERKTGWFVAPNTKVTVTVRAYDQARNYVFCRAFVLTYETVTKEYITVDINRGEFSCD